MTFLFSIESTLEDELLPDSDFEAMERSSPCFISVTWFMEQSSRDQRIDTTHTACKPRQSQVGFEACTSSP